MGASWDKLDADRTWQSPGFSDTGIGERAIPWPSFSGATENPTCKVCGGRLRGAKKVFLPTAPRPLEAGGAEKRIPRTDGVGQASYGFRPGAPAQPGVRGEIRALPSYNASGNVQCRFCGKWKWGHKEGDSGGGGKACSCTQPEFRNIKLDQAQGMALWHSVWLREAHRVLKPGAMVQAMSGTRTYHRLVQAMMMVGFKVVGIRAWQHGQGFPKSLAIDKALDQAARVERDVICQSPNWRPAKTHGGAGFDKLGKGTATINITTPATDAAKRYAGYGTALKPAFEPVVVAVKGDPPTLPSCLSRVITLARKPLGGNVAQTVLKWGTGGLNIDGCRVGTVPPSVPQPAFNSKTGLIYGFQTGKGRNGTMSHATGRYPANLILQHAPGCRCVGTADTPGYAINRWNDGSKPFGGGAGHPFTSTEVPPARVDVWECVEGCPMKRLDAQGGIRPGMSGGGARDNEKKASWVIQPFNRQIVRDEWIRCRCGTGGASRFFKQVQGKE